MSAHPKHQSGVLAVPAASPMPPEKRPRLAIILVCHQHSHSSHFRSVPSPGRGCASAEDACNGIAGSAALVFLPDDGEEEGAGTVHDGYVGEFPVAVIRD